MKTTPRASRLIPDGRAVTANFTTAPTRISSRPTPMPMVPPLFRTNTFTRPGAKHAWMRRSWPHHTVVPHCGGGAVEGEGCPWWEGASRIETNGGQYVRAARGREGAALTTVPVRAAPVRTARDAAGSNLPRLFRGTA